MLRRSLCLVLLASPLAPLSAQEFRPSEAAELQRPLGFATASDAERPIDLQRDANGNRVAVRRGAASAMASGNVLNVTVEGSGNSVTVNSSQVNSGASQALLVLNGRLDLGS